MLLPLTTRWTQVNQDLADQLQEARGQLQLWKASHSAHTEAAAGLQQQEAKFQQLANINVSGNNLADILPPALRDIKVGTKAWGENQAESARQTGLVRDVHDLGMRQTGVLSWL